MEESKKLRNTARAVALIPVVVFVLLVICFAAAGILEGPTARGSVYTTLMLIFMGGVFITPIPCVLISIISIVMAVKAKGAGAEKCGRIIVLGVIDILVALFVGSIFMLAMFVVGASV